MVTLAEAKSHIRVTHDEEDEDIQKMIEAAVDHLRSIDVDMTVDPLPPALHHSVLLLVGHFFDNREVMTEGANKVMPFGVSRLTAPYRSITL